MYIWEMIISFLGLYNIKGTKLPTGKNAFLYKLKKRIKRGKHYKVMFEDAFILYSMLILERQRPVSAILS